MNNTKKITLITFSALVILFILPSIQAICCGDRCYDGGVCDTSTNTWSRGCSDSNNNMYQHGDFLGDCLRCECSSADDCEWSQWHSACSTRTPLCQIIGQDGQAPTTSTCTDLDVDEQTCLSPSRYDGSQVLASCTHLRNPSAQWIPFADFNLLLAANVNRYRYYASNVVGSDIYGCCGDDYAEHIVTDGNGQSVCCDARTDCIDDFGVCRGGVEEPGVLEDGVETCGDSVDNDCDGLSDGDDPGCCVPTQEICDDGIDNDCDLLVDEDDQLDCCSASETLCGDDFDNDCDGAIDACDSDCPAVAELECTDGQDNDCDGLIDECDLTDCPGVEICGDLEDNDCDALIDGADPDCCSGTSSELCCQNALGSNFKANTYNKFGCCTAAAPSEIFASSDYLCMDYEWLSPTPRGVIYDTGDFDIVSGWYTCDAKEDSDVISGVTELNNLKTTQITINTQTHGFACYHKADDTERIAECHGSDVPFSSSQNGGERYTNGESITDISGTQLWCCSDSSWYRSSELNNNPACTAAQINSCAGGNILAQSGEKDPIPLNGHGSYTADDIDRGVLSCCGDDTADEFYVDSGSFQGGGAACCASASRCVQNGICRDTSSLDEIDINGAYSCLNGIDDDCDGNYDIFESANDDEMPDLVSSSIDFRSGDNLGDLSCVAQINGVVLDGLQRVEDAEVTLTCRMQYDGSDLTQVYKAYTDDQGLFTLKYNGGGSCDLVASIPGLVTGSKFIESAIDPNTGNFETIECTDPEAPGCDERAKLEAGEKNEFCDSGCASVGAIPLCMSYCDSRFGDPNKRNSQCRFHDQQIAELCNEVPRGHPVDISGLEYAPGQFYDDGTKINCCEGIPYVDKREKVRVETGLKNCIKHTRIVIDEVTGEKIKVVTTNCGG